MVHNTLAVLGSLRIQAVLRPGRHAPDTTITLKQVLARSGVLQPLYADLNYLAGP